MDDIISQIKSAAIGSVLEKENDLLIEALRRATGEQDPNPYRYINRMSKQERVDGTVIYLDGKEILLVRKPTFTPMDDRITTIKVQYCHYLPERK